MATFKYILITPALEGTFDDVLDVRSPSEFAADHLPRAINLPVLNDEERVRVGTLYLQSPFEAQRLGAAMISRNIARHLETVLQHKPKSWQALIYCWRGGMRSGAMAHVLAQVGWRISCLQGGYKTYRRHVLDALDVLPAQFDLRVVCGPTGSGKSRLLQSLAAMEAQVLDLEQLSQHRGSLLGNLPGQAQPAQKMFESRVWEALRGFDLRRPVFVEAESRMIGVLRVPEALLGRMRTAPCIAIEAALQARIELLLEDYAHFLSDPDLLGQRLALLTELHGHKIIAHWNVLAGAGLWSELVQELLERHYDPAYRRSSEISFEQLKRATLLSIDRLDPAGIDAAARRCLEM